MIKLKEIISTLDVEYSETMRDYHSGQSYMTAYAKIGKEIVGYCDYSIYRDKVYIEMIEVEEKFQRKGIATGLMDFIKQENKDKDIIPGMATDAGHKFWKAYQKR